VKRSGRAWDRWRAARAGGRVSLGRRGA